MLRKIKAFFKGMGSVLNLSGNYYYAEHQRILNRTDAEALASDWEAIGRDFRKVMPGSVPERLKGPDC